MNVYERALEVLDERGWTQGRLADNQGRVCLVGALSVARFGDPDAWLSAVNIRIYGGMSLPLMSMVQQQSLIEFNDDHSTTEEDVRLLLKRAAAGER